jgi:protocatechuate 3,4-dioxygenase beta subunit
MEPNRRVQEAETAFIPPLRPGRVLHDKNEPIFDQGLAFDVETLMDRRQVIKLLGYSSLAVGLMAIAGCAPGPSASPSSAASSATPGASGTASTASCEVIPEETAGPFPGDGSNGPDVLNQSGIVRSDIRSSFGSSSGTAKGVPLTIKLAIQNEANNCAPLAGAAVYLWHCDQEGRYSLYSQGATNQNYLRGVQEADGNGQVTFVSVFPACYQGRWPHIHFEVYPSLATATNPSNKIATSQIALPKEICDTVYATDGYSQSVTTLAGLSLASDNVFRDDGGARQLGTMSGSIEGSLTVELAVPVKAA